MDRTLELLELPKLTDPKLFKKALSACRKATRARRTVERERVLGMVAKQALQSGSHVLAETARAHGLAIRGWLGNEDPVTWAGGAVAVTAYLTWLTILLGSLSKKLGLGTLIDLIPGTPNDVLKTIQDITPDVTVHSGSGPYCFRVKSQFPFLPATFIPVDPTVEFCSMTPQERAQKEQDVKNQLGFLANLVRFEEFQK